MFSRLFDYFRDAEDNDPSLIRLAQGMAIFVVLVNVALLLAGEQRRATGEISASIGILNNSIQGQLRRLNDQKIV
ncbi:MAG: hypothetical protein HY865_06215 [Chloroflexi bacterium]|nr:hypothetical protein [Chloroflexota bacterium]